MFGRLYVVATPIGNLSDITLRALEVFGLADTILCEDTRVTAKLLKLLRDRGSLSTTRNPSLISYHQHSSESRKLEILKMLIDGNDLVLVTDAGTPGVSDPGNELIHYLVDKEPLIQIVTIPGASSLTSALSICGFDVTRFVFLGFLPKKRRSKYFTLMKELQLPFVFFESPNRIVKTLLEIEEFFGSNQGVFAGRELTKLHETNYRGRVSEVIKLLQKDDKRGEVVVVVEK